MGFKPREKNKDKFVFEDSFDVSSNVETTEKIKPKQEAINSKKIDIKKYEEMTIEVLNILDKKGINIYDSNRTPGMYLNKKNMSRVTANNIIEKLSEENKSFEESRESSTNIFNFLLNK